MGAYANYNPTKERLKEILSPVMPLYRKTRDLFLAAMYKPENKKRLLKSKEQLLALKGIHSGERCFIIGNGPSLKSEDLDKLKGEICFGVNTIYNLYDETDWRPTYYCLWDTLVLYKICDAVSKEIKGTKLIGIHELTKNPEIKGALYVKIEPREFYPNLPAFSDDITECVYEGNSVLYMCFQAAAYMGFSEIYLLGVDHNYSVNLRPDGKIEHADGVKDHFSEKDKLDGLPQLQKSTLAFQAAKEYGDKHGIRIYNATRGGKLEVFERVDLDSVIKN